MAPLTKNVPTVPAGWWGVELLLEVVEVSGVGVGVQARMYEGEGLGLVWSRVGGQRGVSCKAEGR